MTLCAIANPHMSMQLCAFGDKHFALNIAQFCECVNNWVSPFIHNFLTSESLPQIFALSKFT